jgi:hypothetical protein
MVFFMYEEYLLFVYLAPANFVEMVLINLPRELLLE